MLGCGRSARIQRIITADGTLDKVRLWSHLAGCPDCRNLADMLQAIRFEMAEQQERKIEWENAPRHLFLWCRIVKGWGRKEAALHFGCSQSAWRSWELGPRNPKGPAMKLALFYLQDENALEDPPVEMLEKRLAIQKRKADRYRARKKREVEETPEKN